MIDRGIVSSASSAGHRIRRIADDHVELHIASKDLGEPSFDVVGVDKRIGMGLEPLFAIKDYSGRTAVLALLVRPYVFHPLEPDVAIFAAKALSNGMLAVCVLRAVDAAPCQQTGEKGDSDAKDLVGEDVIDALFEVWNLGRQTSVETAGELA